MILAHVKMEVNAQMLEIRPSCVNVHLATAENDVRTRVLRKTFNAVNVIY